MGARLLLVLAAAVEATIKPNGMTLSPSEGCATSTVNCEMLMASLSKEDMAEFPSIAGMVDSCASSAGEGCVLNVSGRLLITGKPEVCDEVLGYSIDPTVLNGWIVDPQIDVYSSLDQLQLCVTTASYSPDQIGLCAGKALGTRADVFTMNPSAVVVSGTATKGELIFPGCQGVFADMFYLHISYQSGPDLRAATAGNTRPTIDTTRPLDPDATTATTDVNASTMRGIARLQSVPDSNLALGTRFLAAATVVLSALASF